MTKPFRERFAPAIAAVALLLALAVGATAIQPQHADAAREDAGRSVTLAASAARTATGAGSTFCGFAPYTKFAAQLAVSAASGTTPTLDVTWQHSIDGGTTWFTVVAFTQRTAAANELKVEAEVEAATAEVYGDCMRIIWTIGGTTPSFTFSSTLVAQ